MDWPTCSASNARSPGDHLLLARHQQRATSFATWARNIMSKKEICNNRHGQYNVPNYSLWCIRAEEEEEQKWFRGYSQCLSDSVAGAAWVSPPPWPNIIIYNREEYLPNKSWFLFFSEYIPSLQMHHQASSIDISHPHSGGVLSFS